MRRLLLCLLLLVPARVSQGFVLQEDELAERSTTLGVQLRTFSFILAGDVLAPPYLTADQNPMALGLFDVRLSLTHRRPWLKLTMHDQLNGQIRSHALAGPLVLGRGLEPPRWLPLQWTITDSTGFTLRDAIDWAYATVIAGPVSVTAGRQPVSFGRGKLWKPYDLVSTFALTEVDTEYKPGVDAVRVDVQARERMALTVLSAAGKRDGHLALRGSSFVLRGTQGWGAARSGRFAGEAGILVGFVRRDVVVGLDGVVDLGKADLYAEFTVTVPTAESLTPRKPDTPPAVARAVLGTTFKPWRKLTVSPELYYGGFGAWTPRDYLGVALSERVGVGELYNLGRLYAGAVVLYQPHPLLDATLGVIGNLRDPSGLVSVGLSYNVAASVQLQVGAFLPVGRLPDPTRFVPPVGLPEPRSEFGLYPFFVFLELKAAM
jgi:hypothetical protein